MEAIAPRVCFPAQSECLERIRAFSREVLAAHCDPKLGRMLVLAIDEAAANVIEHAYKSAGSFQVPMIELSIDVQADRILIRLLDRGRPFDPTQAPCCSQARYEGSAALLESARAGIGPDDPRARGPKRGFGLQLI